MIGSTKFEFKEKVHERIEKQTSKDIAMRE